MMKSEGRVLSGARFVFPFAAFLAFLWFATRPCISVFSEGNVLASCPADPGMEFSTRFIHSVQKTPVQEKLRGAADKRTLELGETRYHSFGVGLPFLASEGEFRQEGNDFVLTGMERRVAKLSLRTGVGTQLALTLAGAGFAKRFELYEEFAPGTLIELGFAPLYKCLISEE